MIDSINNTPTPWRLGEDKKSIFASVAHPVTGNIDISVHIAEIQDAEIYDGYDDTNSYKIEGQDKINAAFIVKAVNCHEQLVEALKAAMHGVGDERPWYKQAQAALAAVEAQ